MCGRGRPAFGQTRGCRKLTGLTPVVTVMKTERANRALMGVPMTSVLSPLTDFTAARIAEAIASGVCTKPEVRPAMRPSWRPYPSAGSCATSRGGSRRLVFGASYQR